MDLVLICVIWFKSVQSKFLNSFDQLLNGFVLEKEKFGEDGKYVICTYMLYITSCASSVGGIKRPQPQLSISNGSRNMTFHRLRVPYLIRETGTIPNHSRCHLFCS